MMFVSSSWYGFPNAESRSLISKSSLPHFPGLTARKYHLTLAIILNHWPMLNIFSWASIDLSISIFCVKHFRVSFCPAKGSSSNNRMGQVLISTTASGDHNMVNRVNGTTRNLSGVSSRNLNSETGINETIVWITTINNNELLKTRFQEFRIQMRMTDYPG